MSLTLLVLFLTASVAQAVQPSPGCGQKLSEGMKSGKTTKTELRSGGLERSYLLHVQKGYASDLTKPRPLFVQIHGWTGNGRVMRDSDRLDLLADASDFLVVWPDAVAYQDPKLSYVTNWALPGCNSSPGAGSPGAVCTKGDAYPCDASSCGERCSYGDGTNCDWCGCQDDAGFIRDLVTSVGARFCVDLDRVYLAGISNGGMFTGWAAGQLSDVFAGAVVVAGTSPVGFHEPPSAEADLSLFWIHGRSDGVVRPDGLEGDDGYLYQSAEAEAGATARRYGCAEESTPWPVSESVDAPAAAALRCREHSGCGESGRQVVYCLWDGGHDWPGRSGKNGAAPWGSRLMTELLLRHSK